MRFFAVTFFFLINGLFSSMACDSARDTEGDLQLWVRVYMAIVSAASDAQSRERLEFQMDLMRAIKRGRFDEVGYLFALLGADHGCTVQRPNPAFLKCFDGFDFIHAKLLSRAFSSTPPTVLLPACAPFLENCLDMRMHITDNAGHDVELEANAICRYRGRYWIFGKLECWRRQSDSNR